MFKILTKWRYVIVYFIISVLYLLIFQKSLIRHFGYLFWWYFLPWPLILCIWGIVATRFIKARSIIFALVVPCLISIFSELAYSYGFYYTHGKRMMESSLTDFIIRSIILNFFWGNIWFFYTLLLVTFFINYFKFRQA
jgi:hypothetical protein